MSFGFKEQMHASVPEKVTHKLSAYFKDIAIHAIALCTLRSEPISICSVEQDNQTLYSIIEKYTSNHDQFR